LPITALRERKEEEDQDLPTTPQRGGIEKRAINTSKKKQGRLRSRSWSRPCHASLKKVQKPPSGQGLSVRSFTGKKGSQPVPSGEHHPHAGGGRGEKKKRKTLSLRKYKEKSVSFLQEKRNGKNFRCMRERQYGFPTKSLKGRKAPYIAFAFARGKGATGNHSGGARSMTRNHLPRTEKKKPCNLSSSHS